MSIQIPEPLTNRHLGSVPVSIGTANAIDGMLGVIKDDRGNPTGKLNKPPYVDYSVLAINIRTIVRNIVNSVPTDYLSMLDPLIATELLMEEIRVLNEVIKSLSDKRLEVSFYAGLYKNYATKFPKANIKQVTANRRKESDDRETLLFNLLESSGYKKELKYKIPNIKLNISEYAPEFGLLGRISGNVMFLTHLPLDLLMIKVRKYALLESHTGKIKTLSELNSKLKGKPENIPFNIATLQIFGDNSGMFNPMNKSIREEVLALATKCKWHSMTGKDKILLDSKHHASKELYALIRELYKSG